MKTSHIERVFQALNEKKVRYLVVGGLAVVAHGYVRLTADVDLVVDLEEKNLRAALNALKKLGFQPRVPVDMEDFADSEKRNCWIEEKGMVVFSIVSEQCADAPVDIFVSVPFDFEKEFQKAEWMEISPGASIPIVSLEQLIRLKETADRDKDRLDLAELKKMADES